jgi:hypothetical protein
MERSFTEQVKNNSFLPPPTTTEGGGGSNDDDAAALVYSSKRSYTFTLLFVFFVLIFTWWSYVATFLQYYAQSEEWTLAENYLGLMYLGFICSITFICYLYFDLRLYKRKNLLIGMLFMILGSILLLADGSDGRYSTISYVANSLLAVGFSLSTVELPAIYSLLAISHASNARDRSGVQSVTWFFAFVSLARCAGPVFGAYMSNKADIRTLARSCAYLLLAAFGLALLMLGNSALKKRLNILSQHT